MDFDLQKFVSELHSENRADILRLTREVQEGFSQIKFRADILAENLILHEKADASVFEGIRSRLEGIESLMNAGKWFFRTGIVAALAFLFNLVLTYLKH